jgi:uncharacterized membrane protein
MEPTWGSHSHFIKIKYAIRGPIGWNIVCSSSPSHSSPYNNNPPYFCFPLFGEWYTYSRSCIKCGFCVFTIIGGIINIRFFNAANKVWSLVSLGVGPLYITSSWFSYSRLKLSYFGCTSGIHIICWIVCGWSSPWRS